MSSHDNQPVEAMTPLSAVRNAKVALRHAMRQKTSQVTSDSTAKQSAAISSSILGTDHYKDASAISIYLSMPKGEVTTKTIASDAIAKGKTVYVPFIRAGSKPGVTSKYMDMVSLHSQDDLERCEGNRDKWGIPSIDESSFTSRKSLLASPEISLDIVLMPGLAFDLKCKRLGHGKGFYDGFLANYALARRDKSSKAMPCLIGMALFEQVLPEGEDIPVDDKDWLLDALAIGDGSLLVREKQ